MSVLVRLNLQSLDVFPGSRASHPQRTSPLSHHLSENGPRICLRTNLRACTPIHQEAVLAFCSRHRSSSQVQYRNINLLSIGCAFRPGLRDRLTPGGRTCPGKPWDSGVGDSHPDFRYSCPHNHSQTLQWFLRATFNAVWDALLPRAIKAHPRLRHGT